MSIYDFFLLDDTSFNQKHFFVSVIFRWPILAYIFHKFIVRLRCYVILPLSIVCQR